MKEFHGTSAMVTGGAQGIGKAVTQLLLVSGARVLMADIDREAGEETVEEYSGLGDIEYAHTDVSNEESVRNAVQTCVSHFGRIDGLVNNAAIAASYNGPVEELSLDVWNRVIQTNLTGCFLCAKHAAAHLRDTQGAIVNIASTRALQSEANTEAYSASKGGIVALTHSLAVSLGPDIRVNCISPGWISVGHMKKSRERTKPAWSEADHAQHPVGRVGEPMDVAHAVAYLLSPRSSFVTGQNLVVDGGMSRKMIYVE